MNRAEEIKTRSRLRDLFGSIHSRGSIGAIEESVHCLLEQEAPAGVPIERVKRELALMWLERPKKIFARIRWAYRLVREL